MAFAIKKFGIDYVTLRGGWFNMIWEIVYRQSWVFICYIAFTYAVIYYILPRFISNKKKWIITTGILLLLLIAFLAMAYFMTYLASKDTIKGMIKQGIPTLMPGMKVIVLRTIAPVVFYLTALVGLAITIKLLKRWWLQQKETEQIAKEKVNAELQLLKAQIHPHFLFNSLNNIYSFAIESSPKAPEMIQKLSGLLHYMLYDCKQALVPIEKELKMIEDYISLEKIRYGERLHLDTTILDSSPAPGSDIENKLIAPLLLIPFVENSFKHGTSKMLTHPWVKLNISVKGNILFFKLINSKPTETGEISVSGNHGLGLKNVQKRLSLIYPDRHKLEISDDPSEYSVWLEIILANPEGVIKKTSAKKEEAEYELA